MCIGNEPTSLSRNVCISVGSDVCFLVAIASYCFHGKLRNHIISMAEKLKQKLLTIICI